MYSYGPRTYESTRPITTTTQHNAHGVLPPLGMVLTIANILLTLIFYIAIAISGTPTILRLLVTY